MAKPPAKPTDNLIPMTRMREYYKSKEYPEKAKGLSFFAFLFSILLYISIFYIFNLSPSELFSNPKFWFFISNTLILIIAADYGAFSSSKQKLDLYEQYVMNSQARSSAASFVSQYPEIVKNRSIIPKDDQEGTDPKNKEDENQKNNETETIPEERILEVVKYEPTNPADINTTTNEEKVQENAPKDHNEADGDGCGGGGGDGGELVVKKTARKSLGRSKSDKAKPVEIVEEVDKNNAILQRSETEKHETLTKVEENEFLTMSNEELNRRAEEFIQRVNRQIRLQGARNRQLLSEDE